MTDKNVFLSGFVAGRHLRVGANAADVLVAPSEKQDFFNGIAAGLVESKASSGHIATFWEWITAYGRGSFPLSWDEYQADSAQVDQDNSSSVSSGTNTVTLSGFTVNNAVPFRYPVNPGPYSSGVVASDDRRDMFSTSVTNGSDNSWSTVSEALEDIPPASSWKVMCASIASLPITLKRGTVRIAVTNPGWETDEFAIGMHSVSLSVFRPENGSYAYIGGFELNSGKTSFSLTTGPKELSDCIIVPFVATNNYNTTMPAGTQRTASSGPSTITNSWSFSEPPVKPLRFGPLSEGLASQELWSHPLLKFDAPNEDIGQYYNIRTGQYESISTLAFSASPADKTFSYTVNASANYRTVITFQPYAVVVEVIQKSNSKVVATKTLYYAGPRLPLPRCFRILRGDLTYPDPCELDIMQTIPDGAEIDWGDGTVDTISALSGRYTHSYTNPSWFIQVNYIEGNEVYISSASTVTFADVAHSRHLLGMAAGLEYSVLNDIGEKEFSCVNRNTVSYVAADGGPLDSLIVHSSSPQIAVGAQAFQNLQTLKHVHISSQLASVGEYAFSYCSSLRGVLQVAENAVISDYAFAGCSSLEALVLPKKLASIGYRAFWNCAGFERIYIDAATELYQPSSSSVTNVWFSMFGHAKDLKRIDISEYREDYRSIDGVVYSKDGSTLIFCPPGRSGRVVIPSGVTEIGPSAFYGCANITHIDIPEGVTRIGASAFYQCTSLETVNLPDSLSEMGGSVFYGCSGLQAIPFWPESLSEIPNYTFQYCSGLADIVIPDGVRIIGTSAFSNCSHLQHITIPDTVDKISQNAFYSSPLVGNLELKTTEIGQSAFSGSKLNKVWLRSTVAKLGASVFRDGKSTLRIYAEPDARPQAWSQFYNYKTMIYVPGAGYSYADPYTVTYGQKTQPW